MGLQIAKQLASHGAILSLADLNESGLEAARAGLDGDKDKHIITAVDVRSSASVDAWIKRTVDVLGGIDGAVNFAGVVRMAKVADESDDGWDYNMNVNAKGVFHCLRAQIRNMKPGGSIVSLFSSPFDHYSKQASNQSIKHGIILIHVVSQVSAASVDAHIGWEELGSYCASKHAVAGLCKSAARENPHLRINCVSPGNFPYDPYIMTVIVEPFLKYSFH